MDRWSLSSSSKMAEEELEGLIRYYFVRGFEYVETYTIFREGDQPENSSQKTEKKRI